MIQISKGDNFPVPLKFYRVVGNIKTYYDSTTLEFKSIYIDVQGNEYEVSHLGDTYVNCYVKDGQLYAKFENHKLQRGVLNKKFYLYYNVDFVDAGENFTDGNWSLCYERQSNIELI